MLIYGRYRLPDCILLTDTHIDSLFRTTDLYSELFAQVSLTGILLYHNSIYNQKIQDINDTNTMLVFLSIWL